MSDRQLTAAQAARMYDLGRTDEDAKIIGWEPQRGPLIVRGDGRVQTITPSGRLLSRSASLAE